jgi:hypothetical protein
MRESGFVMSAKLRLVPETEEREANATELRQRRIPGWPKWAVLVAGLAGAIFFWVWSDGAEERAIRHLPVSDRQALLARTLQNLRSVCQSPDEGMRSFCAEQARLAIAFPECDVACRALAEKQLSRVQLPR